MKKILFTAQMATNMMSARDLVITLKKETLLNVGILSKLHPMSSDLSRLLKENNLEKPTQNLFNHLAYYLVSIIDPNLTLPWPLYDSKTERTYRNEVSVFISDYSSKGLLAPVMTSYLVNPGCYKVVFLVFQMSQLAVQRTLMTKMNEENQKTLYNDMTEKYKSQNEESSTGCIEKELTEVRNIFLSKFSNYLSKRKAMENIAKKLREQITKLEYSLKSLKAQEYINNLVDGYIKTHTIDDETRKEILEIKNVQKPAKYFDKCLAEVDKQLSEMESNWESKMAPFMELCQTTFKNTEALIARQTGEADKRTYMIEYNPKTDYLCTDELEKQVNTQQKYILKNIIKGDVLNFPNLIRGFLISIGFILKNAEIGDEIFTFNEYLSAGRRNYGEVVNAMKTLMVRLMKAEGKLQLQQSQETFSSTVSSRDITEIPPLPDLSDLKMNREYHPQIIFDSFTPLNFSKHQFNLRKQKTGSFMKPQPKAFATPFHLTSCKVNAYDNTNVTQNNNLNMSVVSQVRNNETIAECTSGFTKQQIMRLLSTKKSSSSKKFKRKNERPDFKIVKGGLFNESNLSNESMGVFRSHSSPNLFENRDKRSRAQIRSRRLSIMREDSPYLLEVSGIAALERDSNHSTPQGVMSLDSSRKLTDAASLPSISTHVIPEIIINNYDADLNKNIEFKAPQIVLPVQRKSRLPQPTSKKVEGPPVVTSQRVSIEICEELTVLPQRKSTESCEEEMVLPQRKSTDTIKEGTRTETPKTNPKIVKKTSSLEKIINRFKKVRASVLPLDTKDESSEIKTIVEEKENLNSFNAEVFNANRNLLPDLLSPSCSVISTKSNKEFLEELYNNSDDEQLRKPRESLGAALGVDHTFLDQFDIID